MFHAVCFLVYYSICMGYNVDMWWLKEVFLACILEYIGMGSHWGWWISPQCEAPVYDSVQLVYNCNFTLVYGSNNHSERWGYVHQLITFGGTTLQACGHYGLRGFHLRLATFCHRTEDESGTSSPSSITDTFRLVNDFKSARYSNPQVDDKKNWIYLNVTSESGA